MLSGVLIGLLVLLGLAVLGAILAGWYLVHNVRVEESRDETGKLVRVETPLGSLRLREGGPLDPAKAGIPVYPGAQTDESDAKSVSLELDLGSEHQGLAIFAAHYVTDDPFDKIVEFYRKELPHWVIRTNRPGNFQIRLSETGLKRFVAIRARHGRTRIDLAQLGEPPTI